MKTKFNFRASIRITGILAIVLAAVVIFLFLASPKNDQQDSSLNQNVVLDLKYGKMKEGSDEEILSNISDVTYYTESKGPTTDFKDVDSREVLIKATLMPIEKENTYLLIDASEEVSKRIKIFTEDYRLVSSTPEIKKYDGNSMYSYYILPTSDESYSIYIYLDTQFGVSDLKNSIILIGTKTDLILRQGYNSIANFIFAGTLLILGCLIYVIFYITSIEKYNIVRVLALTSFVISIQCSLFSPFFIYIFGMFSEFFILLKIFLYMMLCILSYFLMYFSFAKKKQKMFYLVNIILAVVFMLFCLLNEQMKGNSINILEYYNIYYVLVSIYAIIQSAFHSDDRASVDILKLLAYTSMVLLNVFFLNYATRYAQTTFGTSYLYLLFLYTISVMVYIFSIFYYRSKAMNSTKEFLYDEQETINRLYNSNKNAITTTNVPELADNILSDVTALYPNLVFAMIIHKSSPSSEIEVPAFTEGYKGNIKEYAKKIYRKYYKRIEKSSFKTDFTGNQAYFIFRSSTGESLLIFLKKKDVFTELDVIAGKILASPILLTFNNCRIYDEIENTEKELLYAIGKVTDEKSGIYTDIWRVGEFSYLLSKNIGLTETFAKNMRLAAYIHNIGKIGIEDRFINFSVLSESDKNEFFKHTQIGYDMLSELSGEVMQVAAIGSLYHHEAYSGIGYLGKASEEIPIEARIITICSEFEKIYAKTEYMQRKTTGEARDDENKKSKKDKKNKKNNEVTKDTDNIEDDTPLDEGFKYLSENKQIYFDPRLVQVFIKDREGVEDIILRSKIRDMELEKQKEE